MGKIRPKRDEMSSGSESDEENSSTRKKSVSWALDNENSGDEVLAFDDDSTGSDDDEDLSGAWGTSRKTFYNEDVNADDDDANFEEKEATQIQKKYFEMLQKSDFALDLFEEKRPTNFNDEHLDEQSRQRHIILPSNLLDLSSNDRLQLLRDQSPEIEKFATQLKKIFDDLKIFLLPFVSLVVETSSLNEFEKYSGWQFVLATLELFLVYSSYLSLVLTMKSVDPNISRHPIENELNKYEKLRLLIQDDFDAMKNDLLKLCEILQERKSKMKTQMKTNENSVKPHLRISSEKKSNGILPLRERMAERREKREAEEKEIEKATNEKRAITYQIEKNKGLTVRRKKEYRNPRVRHRNKYERALIKRKSRVPTARTENEKYVGEPTGIRAGLKRGIKLKS